MAELREISDREIAFWRSSIDPFLHEESPDKKAEIERQLRNETDRDKYKWRLNVRNDGWYREPEVEGPKWPEKLFFTHDEHINDQVRCYVKYYLSNRTYTQHEFEHPRYSEKPISKYDADYITQIMYEEHQLARKHLRSTIKELLPGVPLRRYLPHHFFREWTRSKNSGRLVRRWPMEKGIGILTSNACPTYYLSGRYEKSESIFKRLRAFLRYYNESRENAQRGEYATDPTCPPNVFESWLIVDFFESIAEITTNGADGDIMPRIAISPKRYKRIMMRNGI